MQRLLGVLTMAVLLGATACGEDKVTPVGADAGVPDAGEKVADAGVPHELPFSQWCSTVETGHKNMLLKGERACGQTGITEEDLIHLLDGNGFPVNAYRLMEYVTCDPNTILGTVAEQFAESIAAGRMTYDAQKACECRELGRSANGDIDPYDGGFYLVGPCGAVLEGNVGLGATCQFNEECIDGTYCKPGAADACAGTCAPRIAVGARCTPGRDLCVLDAHCALDGAGNAACRANPGPGGACNPMDGPPCRNGLQCVNQACVAPAAEGKRCSESTPCQAGFTCADGTCMKPGGLGDACGAQLPACDMCLRCQDPSEVAAGESTTCVSASVGSTCLGPFDCPTHAFCDTVSGTCMLKPKPGERCLVSPDESGALPSTANVGNCLYFDSFCQRTDPSSASGICARMPEAGQPCTADGKCSTSAYCVYAEEGSMCVAKGGTGESCFDDDQCVSDFCERASGTCMSSCTDTYEAAVSCGCPGEGAKGYSMYLLLALVLAPNVARRHLRASQK